MPLVRQQRIKTQWSPIGRTEISQDYYTVREAVHDFSGYWSTSRDPDGTLRDRLSERERLNYLDNMEEEMRFVESLRPGRILDVGCGPGWLLAELSGEWKKLGCEVCQQAVTEMARRGIQNVTDLQDVPPNWADVVTCMHVIEHLVDPIQMIGEIHRIMHRDSWLVIGTPDFESPCAMRFGRNYRMLHDATHCSLFTLESMHRFLRDHGLEIMDLRFPFPDKYATAENFARWNDVWRTSPPWPGNWMTFYCRKS